MAVQRQSPQRCGKRIKTAVAVFAFALSSGAFGQAAHTHWEPYKNSGAKPSVDQKLMDPVLVGAIDLHAHFGPDSYPRQWDAFEIAALAKERGLRAIVFKNHWSESAGLAYLIRKHGVQGIEVFGSVTLDTPTGGLNPQAVRYMADVTGGYGRVVWMPTHDSEHEVLHNKGEPSVVQRTLIRPPMSRVGPLTDDERRALIAADAANFAKYAKTVDAESAAERLESRNSPVGQVKEKLRRFGNLFGLKP